MAASQFLFLYLVAILLAAEHSDAACWLVGLYAMAVVRSILQSRWF